MKTYKVTYTGNSTKGKMLCPREFAAESKRDAVETLFSEHFDQNYFPQEDGSIADCNGYMIAGPDDDCIEYDGGSFIAEEIE